MSAHTSFLHFECGSPTKWYGTSRQSSSDGESDFKVSECQGASGGVVLSGSAFIWFSRENFVLARTKCEGAVQRRIRAQSSSAIFTSPPPNTIACNIILDHLGLTTAICNPRHSKVVHKNILARWQAENTVSTASTGDEADP